MKKALCIPFVAIFLAGCVQDPLITEVPLREQLKAGETSHEDYSQLADRVFFAYDRYDLSSDARRTLERQSVYLKQRGNVRLIIQGHADEHGTREYNLALGERRAAAVKDYLVALGISPDRLSTVSYGKERPAVLGSNEAAWSQNRRVQSVVLQN